MMASNKMDIISANRMQREFYLNRLHNEASTGEGIEENVKASSAVKYVELLEGQNEMLLDVLAQLQKEMEERTIEMEKRLKSSARTTKEVIANLHECREEMRKLVNDKLCMESALLDMKHKAHMLTQENAYLREQTNILNRDLLVLLSAIHSSKS